MKKKIISILITLSIITVIFMNNETIVSAAPSHYLFVGNDSTGIDIVDGNNITYWLNDGSGGITSTGAGAGNYNLKYDPTTDIPKLTMNELELTKYLNPWGGSRVCGIYGTGFEILEIELIGDNSVDVSSSTCTGENYAIEIYENASFTGDGALEAKSGTSTLTNTAGIRINNEMVVESGTLTFEGGYASYSESASFGMIATHLTINGGDVNTIGGKSPNFSVGAAPYEFVMNDGTFYAEGGYIDTEDEEYESEECIGLYVLNDITINGGELTAFGGNNGIEKYGIKIYSIGNFNVNGGIVNAGGITAAMSIVPILSELKTFTVWAGDSTDTAPVLVSSPVNSTFTEKKIVKIQEGALPAPEIIQGQNEKWKQGTAGSSLTFRSNAPFSEFMNVLVDGNVVDSNNYELREGSIIVVLKAEYLATLSAGTHTLGIQSASGNATTQFVIEPGSSVSPQTGNTINLSWVIIMMIVSGGIGTSVLFRKRKMKI